MDHDSNARDAHVLAAHVAACPARTTSLTCRGSAHDSEVVNEVQTRNPHIMSGRACLHIEPLTAPQHLAPARRRTQQQACRPSENGRRCMSPSARGEQAV